EAEGVGTNPEGDFSGGLTAFYFDQENELFLVNSYDWGLYICGDNGTPTDKGDDDCDDSFGEGVQTNSRVFDILKDDNGMYWFGGDNGLAHLDINGSITR